MEAGSCGTARGGAGGGEAAHARSAISAWGIRSHEARLCAIPASGTARSLHTCCLPVWGRAVRTVVPAPSILTRQCRSPGTWSKTSPPADPELAGAPRCRERQDGAGVAQKACDRAGLDGREVIWVSGQERNAGKGGAVQAPWSRGRSPINAEEAQKGSASAGEPEGWPQAAAGERHGAGLGRTGPQRGEIAQRGEPKSSGSMPIKSGKLPSWVAGMQRPGRAPPPLPLERRLQHHSRCGRRSYGPDKLGRVTQPGWTCREAVSEQAPSPWVSQQLACASPVTDRAALQTAGAGKASALLWAFLTHTPEGLDGGPAGHYVGGRGGVRGQKRPTQAASLLSPYG